MIDAVWRANRGALLDAMRQHHARRTILCEIACRAQMVGSDTLLIAAAQIAEHLDGGTHAAYCLDWARAQADAGSRDGECAHAAILATILYMRGDVEFVWWAFVALQCLPRCDAVKIMISAAS